MNKWRVWDNENNRYFKPIYKAYEGQIEDLTLDMSGELSMRTIPKCAIHQSIFPNRFGPVEFSIGEKDANGVDVYAGDLLREKGNSQSPIYKVVYRYAEFVREYKFIRRYEGEQWEETTHLPIYPQSFVVVGNIHRNKDLLEIK